ncbi:MAG: IS630 family transposase [Bacteroidota bacterium]|nr:IS630 family transposase [Bacteroidota bacterium]
MKQWVIPQASAEFVCAMEEVLDVYELPYEQSCPVICLDESPHQLISETKESFVDSKGVEHVDYEYRREGAVDIYMIAEPKAGRRYVQVRDSHDSHQWAEVIGHIAEKLYPDARCITVVQDNLTAHRKAALYERFAAERARSILRRIHFVQTPKHGSWLNIAEIELSVLNRVALKKRIGSKVGIQKQINAYLKEKNKAAIQINWQFTTKDARIKLKKLYPNV